MFYSLMTLGPLRDLSGSHPGAEPSALNHTSSEREFDSPEATQLKLQAR